METLKKMNNEAHFRLYKDKIFWNDWNKLCNLETFSKDFIREFRDKFQWHTEIWGEVTGPALYVWRVYGDEFLREMTGFRIEED